MASRNEILGRLRDALSLTDPEWDVSVGSPVYKIMEAVATEMAGVYDNALLNDYHFDIDTKTGTTLDAFVEMFGLVRLMGKRATGTVTFSRGTPDHNVDYDIPTGTQVLKPASGVSPAIFFQTTTAATLQAGTTQVEVPAEAVVAGSSGNVNAGTVTLFAGGMQGVTAVINEQPFTGGRDSESDSELRRRWRITLFRNLAGTEDQFLAIALESEAVSRALVVGASRRVREQLEIAMGTISAGVTDAKYFYPQGSEFVGYDLGTSAEDIGVPFTDYTYDATNGTVNFVDTTKFPNGAVVDFEYEYLPESSRNNPGGNVFHRIDVFVSGQDAKSVVEEITMVRDVPHTFNDTAGDPMLRTQWRREDDTTSPTAGNFFMPLANTPVILLPEAITVSSTTYTRNVDYWLVRDVTIHRNSTRARDGIEWLSTNAPANAADVILEYTYNRLVRQIDEHIKQVRLVGTDTMVHRAEYIYLRFHLSIVFNPTYNAGTESESVAAAISEWLETKDFQGNVQISDLIDVIKNLSPIDNVRLTTSTENATAYGIQRIANDGTTVLGTFTSDIYLRSDEIPVLESVTVNTRGSNTF